MTITEQRIYDRSYYRKNNDRILAVRLAHRNKNREKIRAEQRKYRVEHLEYFREKDRKRGGDPKRIEYNKRYSAEYRKSNSEKLRKVAIERRIKNPEKYKASKRADYQRHKEAYKQRVRVRQAIQLGATVDTSQIVELVTQLKASLDTKCAYCGCSLAGLPIHIDHIIPLSRGGLHAASNLCASCPPCNLSKNDKTPAEFEQYKQTIRGLMRVFK